LDLAAHQHRAQQGLLPLEYFRGPQSNHSHVKGSLHRSPRHGKLEPAPCGLSGAVPEVRDPPTGAAAEGTAWVQSCGVSHSHLK